MTLTMRAIDRWRRLRRGEKALVVRAAVEVASMSIGMRVFGIKRMLRAAENAKAANHTATDHAPDRTEYTEHETLVTAVERAGRYIPGGTCLAQSLALARMLGRRGIAADVRVGVVTVPAFHAHAWVEVAGRAITSDSGHERLTH